MRRIALLLVAASACIAAAPAMAKNSVYMSLMGEPFRTTTGGDPFDLWLELADQDGDGAITRLEFLNDAEAFFANLDTNDDKIIDADEMAEYERFAPGRTRAAGGGAQDVSSSRPKPKSSTPVKEGEVAIVSSGNIPSATRIHPGGGRINFSEVPQPVAMADLNLDRRVTLDEFTRTANRRFSNYDVDQDARLTRKELR